MDSLPQVSTKSPTKTKKSKPNQMDFFDALREVNQGKAITKLEWDNPEYFVLMRNGHLTLHKPDKKFYDLIVTDGDMTGEDWIILDLVGIVETE